MTNWIVISSYISKPSRLLLGNTIATCAKTSSGCCFIVAANTVIAIVLVPVLLLLAVVLLTVAVIVLKQIGNKRALRKEHIYETPQEVSGVMSPMKYTSLEREDSFAPPSAGGEGNDGQIQFKHN